MRLLSYAVCLTIAASTQPACKSRAESTPAPPRGDGAVPMPTPTAEPVGDSCKGDVPSQFAPPAEPPPAAPALTLPSEFTIQTIASISAPRHVAALPNGDLLVGTQKDVVYIIPGAEADGTPGVPVAFAKMPDIQAHGVAFAPPSCTIYVGTNHGVFSIPYKDGQTQATATPTQVARVRTIDEGGHSSTSVAFSRGVLYASVGSSCNACVERDPTRATVQAMAPDGTNMTTKARRIRNAIAVAVHPDTGSVWAGGAGQDDLPPGHPYEFMDPISLYDGVVDYGWPDCEENRVAYKAGADCSKVAVARVVTPAYSTILGATFYPTNGAGSFAFPRSYRGGLFVSLHGSWHEEGGKYVAVPRVVFVRMNGDTPETAVDWNNPNHQLTDFLSNFQLADGSRVGRPAGVAVGSRGSLFVADDMKNVVYRVRPR